MRVLKSLFIHGYVRFLLKGDGDHHRVVFGNMEPDMLRGEELVGCGSSYGGDSQQSSRGWENHGPVWRSYYEYAVVTSHLKRVEATESDPDQDENIETLWRKRAELAKGIVDAAAPTIHELLLKVAMTASLLSEGEVGVVLTPQ